MLVSRAPMSVVDVADASLADSLLAGEDVELAQPAEFDIFRVVYRVPGVERPVLSNVSCAFPPGRMSAVMGASGSGKTSLLTLLRGLSAPGSEMTGHVLCNARPVTSEQMRRCCSAVPQEDAFLAGLTVRETLHFAAELRLPRRWTKRSRARRVARVTSDLQLDACSDTLVGDERIGVRGISGGERKRLSIATAIVGGLPSVLLCDEPTSGLDSASATIIISLLRQLTDRRVTVVCSIHQPSSAVFHEFSHLLLLQAGEAAYCGKVLDVEAHFARLGAPTPPHTNPAHHYLQEVSSASSRCWTESWQEATAVPESTRSDGAAKATRARGRGTGSRTGLSLRAQVAVLTRRVLIENFKNRKKFFRGVMMRLPASIVIGLIFWQIGARPVQGSVNTLKGVFLLSVQNPLIESFYAGAAAFQSGKGLLKREYYDGLYSARAFYASYYAGFAAMQIPWTVVWVLPMYFLTGLPGDPSMICTFLLTAFLVILMSCAWGSSVGAWARDQDSARSVLLPLLVPMLLFSGYIIPYYQVPRVWRPLYFLSPVQWGVSILEVAYYSGLEFGDCDRSFPQAERACFATGEEYLQSVGHGFFSVAQMLCICVGYAAAFLVLNAHVVRKYVLNGRV